LLQIFKVHELTSIHKKHYSDSSSLHTEAVKQLCELISWVSKERKKGWHVTGDREKKMESSPGISCSQDNNSGGRVSDGKLCTAIKLEGGAGSLESGETAAQLGDDSIRWLRLSKRKGE
jgi:hypothetical protein